MHAVSAIAPAPLSSVSAARAPEPLGTIPETVVAEKGASPDSGFFGEDGPSFRDIFDAINPLNHIPIISDIFAQETGHQISTAAKLAGGALLGGPIGLVASLVNVVFEQQTGKDVGATMLAALTDAAPSPTMLAANDSSTDGVVLAADADTAEETVASVGVPEPIEQRDLVPASQPIRVASLSPSDTASQQRLLLDLYGASVPSAHRSYQKAQMLPYLRDVTTSQVL